MLRYMSVDELCAQLDAITERLRQMERRKDSYTPADEASIVQIDVDAREEETEEKKRQMVMLSSSVHSDECLDSNADGISTEAQTT